MYNSDAPLNGKSSDTSGESAKPDPKDSINSSAKQRVIKVTKVIVLSTVMFTFISYWRAAAVVLGDLGSTAYYMGGIAEQFVGKVAPYFILGVMVFAFCVMALYLESSPLFTRGGVYRVVKSTLGGWFAKISVSALVFDYILTGPISSVSGGQYLAGLLNDSFRTFGIGIQFDRHIFAMVIAIIIVIFFWWENVKGIEESSSKALKIFIITAVMGVVVITWGIVTLLLKNEPLFTHFPPLKVELSQESYGWLKHYEWTKSIALISILIAFGHSLLALSGLETLGQVYREVEYPKLKNFKRTALIIFIFSVILTPGVSFLGTMLIPDDIRPQYIDNLIGGIAMFLIGPHWLNLVFQAFVVIVGVLILSGAVNTSIVGSNSVLNRVAEDRVLMDWFRKPHKKFGTTYRMLNLIAILQIATIILSQGDILLLGEAYAFGVVWSLTFMGFAMIVLRYKDKRPREWKVPLNINFGKFHLPFGLILIFVVLFFVAITNLFTKPIATISGVLFTVSFFVLFLVSEFINKRNIMKEKNLTEIEFQSDAQKKVIEHFNLEDEAQITPEAIGSELPDRVMVAVRDPNNLNHLIKVINENDTDKTDVIVMIARVFRDKINTEVHFELEGDELHLFSEVVNVAEKIGKPVIPIVVPTNNAFFSIMNVAHSLGVREVVIGLSAKYKPDIQLQQLALMWGTVHSDENTHIKVRIITENSEFNIDL
ncbi:MAG: APC family permease [Ignavibacteriae bacterium]|jgi:amino acid transporter|nr:APC family permease [Ignavibacteriota bacterium]